MNYMKQLTEMLGVELNEEFKITGQKGLFRINEKFGLEVQNSDKHWRIGEMFLDRILLGKDEIIKIPFQPKNKASYYTYGENWKIVEDIWIDYPTDYARKNSDMVFRTYKKAEEARPDIYKKFTGEDWEKKQ